MSNISFATEDDYLAAKQVVREVLGFAEDCKLISAEYHYGADGSLLRPEQVLDKLAFDIVCRIARSNVPVTGDVADMSEVDFQRVS